MRDAEAAPEREPDQVGDAGGGAVGRDDGQHPAAEHADAAADQEALLGLLPVADHPLALDQQLAELEPVGLVVAGEQHVRAAPGVARQQLAEVELGDEIAEQEQDPRPLGPDQAQGTGVTERCGLVEEVDYCRPVEPGQPLEVTADRLAAVARDHGQPVGAGAHEGADETLDHRHAGDGEHRLRHVLGRGPEPHSFPAGLDDHVDVAESLAHRPASVLGCGRFVLAVLGGTSVGTPNLIRALAAARQAGRLPDLELRLHGRAHARGERIIDFACADTPLAGREPSAPIRLRLARSLPEAVRGCDAVLCQVRPGGMEARAEDETMALAEGVPGDEGLGPSGLANYLRSIPVTDAIAEAWADHAPHATFLQLSSPLGLTVARIARRTGLRVLGLCELPATTSAALLAAVEPRLNRVQFEAHSFGRGSG